MSRFCVVALYFIFSELNFMMMIMLLLMMMMLNYKTASCNQYRCCDDRDD